MKKNLSFIVVILFSIQFASAQIELSPTVIASAGSYAEAGNISLSWTLGEIAVSTLSMGDIVLTQGFQQGYKKGTNIKDDLIDWQIIAYPNPVKNNLSIQFDVLEPSTFWIEMQDVSGRILTQKQYKEVYPGDVVSIEMDNFTYGVYFFRIFTPDREQMRVISIRKD